MTSTSTIVQYVVLRGDLLKSMQWPVGAVIAQACHACTAVTHLFYNDPHTQAYLADLNCMHKVVLEVSHKNIYIYQFFIYYYTHLNILPLLSIFMSHQM